MKRLFLVLLFIQISNLSSRAGVLTHQREILKGVNSLHEIQPDSLPDLNREILAFVNTKMKKKVGRGECWDLAAEALNSSNAKWNGKFQFGRKLNADEEILPGDIIQFEGVKIRFQEGNARITQVMKHHTGIVYSKKGPQQFEMANQNTEEHGRKVALTYIDLSQVISGKYFIYRPER